MTMKHENIMTWQLFSFIFTQTNIPQICKIYQNFIPPKMAPPGCLSCKWKAAGAIPVSYLGENQRVDWMIFNKNIQKWVETLR